MKLNLLLSALIVLFGVLTCKNLQKSKEPQAATAETVPVQPAPAPVKTPRSVTVPVDRIPPASASRKAYLSTGWWHMNEALLATDPHVYDHFRDKWLRFHEDQTFEILMNKKVVDKGRWNWDEANSEIYLSCNDPWFNNTWKIKEKGFVMIWIGNTDINTTGIQARVVNSKTEP